MLKNRLVYKCLNNHIQLVEGNNKQIVCNICQKVMEAVGPEIIFKREDKNDSSN
jgi:hypothetical protein